MPSLEMCGASHEQAWTYLTELERATRPEGETRFASQKV